MTTPWEGIKHCSLSVCLFVCPMPARSTGTESPVLHDRLRCRRRPWAGDRKRANLLAGSLPRVVPGPIYSRPLHFLAGSTRVAWFFDCVFWVCWFFLGCLKFGLFGYFAKWLTSGTVSKWCLCRGVSLHKGQLLQDPLTFKQNSSYELFWVFHYIFSFFFTVLVVHPHHDDPVTSVLTHYSPMAWYSFFVLKVPLNTNQLTNLHYRYNW